MKYTNPFFPQSCCFLIEVQLIYNVVLLSALQQSDSVTHMHVYMYIVCVSVCVCVCTFFYLGLSFFLSFFLCLLCVVCSISCLTRD